MTVIYLIRHAEAEGNMYRVFQGHKDVMLTERGELQAKALAERFRDIPIDAVYSSDLYRASATAAGICRIHALPLHRTAALREQFFWEQQWAKDCLLTSDEVSDPALKELFRQLAHQSHVRARDIRAQLERMRLLPLDRSQPAGRVTWNTPEIWFSLFISVVSC